MNFAPKSKKILLFLQVYYTILSKTLEDIRIKFNIINHYKNIKNQHNV